MLVYQQILIHWRAGPSATLHLHTSLIISTVGKMLFNLRLFYVLASPLRALVDMLYLWTSCMKFGLVT